MTSNSNIACYSDCKRLPERRGVKRLKVKKLPGATKCPCGRIISANKKACRECASVPFLDLLA